MLAAKFGRAPVTFFFLEHTNITPTLLKPFRSKWSLLHYLCQAGDVSSIALLKKKLGKLNFDLPGPHKYTPLHLAIVNGRTELVRYILKQGCDVNACTKTLSCLHMAIMKVRHYLSVIDSFQKHHDIAKDLILKGAVDRHENMLNNMSCLLIATKQSMWPTVELLLKHKSTTNSDPNVGDKNGWTPMHEACKQQKADIVELFLKHGGQPNNRDKHKCTPLHVWHRVELLTLLDLQYAG